MRKKPTRSREQIEAVLVEVDRLVRDGSTVIEACDRVGITKPSYYRWRRETGFVNSSESLPSKTVQHILDVAESLCADHGLEVSMREIGREAGVSNGTLSYHFKSRDQLLLQITARRVGDLDGPRYALLDKAEASHNPPRIEDVITAFFLPGLKATVSKDSGMANYMRFMGRLALDPDQKHQEIMGRCYGNLHKRFVFAFSRALPGLSIEEVYWRYTALTGVFVTMAQNPNRINRISGGLLNIDDPHTAMQKLLSFLLPMMAGDQVKAS